MAAILENDERSITISRFDERSGLEIATPEEAQLIRKAQGLKELLDEVAAEYEIVKRQMIERLGDRDGLVSADGKVTYRKAKDSERTGWKKVVTLIGGAPAKIVRDCTATVAGCWRFTLSAK